MFPNEVDGFLSFPFENFVVLGDYVATVSKEDGFIECQLTGAGQGSRVTSRHPLAKIPGVETIGLERDAVETEDFDEVTDTRSSLLSENWRLSVALDGVGIEISVPTENFKKLFGPGYTIKVSGIASTSHDGALESLERFAQAMLLDLDLVYATPVRLATRRQSSRSRRRIQPDHAPKFPQNQYASQPLELYWYGRSAAGLPLLEYLAYYQSIEYFFPFFAREQTMNAVRSQLLHPGFHAHDDAALSRLINLASPAARGGLAEREQLRATIRASIPESELRDFFASLPEYPDHFCSKKQSVRHVGVIQLEHNSLDIRDQVADRIYAIRCRIVHAKQDGGGTNDEVLLPSSTEAGSLQSDVELVRLIAQKALVARASRS